MKCGECPYRYVVHPKYGNIGNSRFTICTHRPELRNHHNSEPKWCPIKWNYEEQLLWIEKCLGIELLDFQKELLRNALDNHIDVLEYHSNMGKYHNYGIEAFRNLFATLEQDSFRITQKRDNRKE